MIKLVKPYTLEIASGPFDQEDDKVYFVSTEVNYAADRFVEDNYELLTQLFKNQGLEFVYVRGKIGKDIHGRAIPPTLLNYGKSTETDGGRSFSAYRVELNKDIPEYSFLLELMDVASKYSRISRSRTEYDEREIVRNRFATYDPETEKLLREMERVTSELKGRNVKPADIEEILAPLFAPGGIKVDARGNLFIPDRKGVTITLNPREKALYLFFLRHPEGVATDEMEDHRDELLQIYRKFTIFDDEDAITHSIDTLLEDRNALYTNVSRINNKIKTVIGERVCQAYLLRFVRQPGLFRSGTYRVLLPAESIHWEIDL